MLCGRAFSLRSSGNNPRHIRVGNGQLVHRVLEDIVLIAIRLLFILFVTRSGVLIIWGLILKVQL
jgi:hypothetical protein